MDCILITNNPTAAAGFAGCTVDYDPALSLPGVLTLARDYVHRGHRLLTHPLSGSVKPNQTPYKTIAVSAEAAAGTDFASLKLIEDAIVTARAMLNDVPSRSWDEETLKDFQVIDYELAAKAVE